MNIIGHKGQPSLQSMYDGIGLKMVHTILKDPSHLLHHEYELIPSGKRYRASRYKSNRSKLICRFIHYTLKQTAAAVISFSKQYLFIYYIPYYCVDCSSCFILCVSVFHVQ